MPKSEKPKRPRRAPGRGRILLGILCILFAAAIAFVLLPRLYQAKSELTTVMRLTRTVEAGTVVTEDMLAEAEAAAYRLPQGFVRSRDEAVGKVAAETLYAGEYLWSARLTESEAYQASIEQQTRGLDGGALRLVTIELPVTSSGVAGVLRAGDTVDVYEYQKSEETEAYTVALLLPDLYVYDVLNRDLVSLTKLDELLEQGEDAATLSGGDALPVYAVFRCAEEQARQLIRLEKDKALHLVLK